MFRVSLVTPTNVNIWFYLVLQIMTRCSGVSVKRLRHLQTSAASCLSVRPLRHLQTSAASCLSVRPSVATSTDISRVMSVRPFPWNNEDTHWTFIRATSYSAVKKVYKWKPMLTRLGRPKNRWEDDIRNDTKKMKIKNWTSCIQDRSKWKLYVEKVKTFKDQSCSAR